MFDFKRRRISLSKDDSPVILMILFLALLYGMNYLYKYHQIQKKKNEHELQRVRVMSDQNTISQTGIISDIKDETLVSQGRVNLVWFVKTPSDGKQWSCSYDAGFSKFRVGDSITLIREKNAEEASNYDGYLVGKSDLESGKVSSVRVLDLQELESENYEDGSD